MYNKNKFDVGDAICVVGLGYVGLPLAVAFSEKFNVIGLDIDDRKIQEYKKGIDLTGDVGDEKLQNSGIHFSSDPSVISKSKFIIVTVPTPINGDKSPDLSPIINATEMISQFMSKGSFIIYESTVYPGVTEEVCIPLIEDITGYRNESEFFVGYSPERVNPGDQNHKIESIVKIVSGTNNEITDFIASTYGKIIKAGIHKAPSIKVAESAKVLENSQRDINIAFMNEVAKILDRMNIETFDVISAMNTKWNSLGFYPGLVGGHCIGVDPHYFLYRANELGYDSGIISAGRKINESMVDFIKTKIFENYIKNDMRVKGSKILIFGITFKENTPDVRNSKIIELIELLNAYDINIFVVDEYADFKKIDTDITYNKISMNSLNNEKNEFSGIVYGVNHDTYSEYEDFNSLLKPNGFIIDLKNKFTKSDNIWKL